MSNCLKFRSMTVDEETLFFIAYNNVFLGLYKADIAGNEVECLDEIPWVNSYDENILLEKINDVLVIAPCLHKNRFLLYDLKAKVFHSIFLEQNFWFGDITTAAFSNVVRFGKSLFFIGNKNGAIVEYCSIKNDFYVHNLMIPKELEKEDLNFFWCSVILEKNVLYLPTRKGGLILVNLENFCLNYIQGTGEFECFCMSRVDDVLWMMPYHGNYVMTFDMVTKKNKLIELPIGIRQAPFMTVIDAGKDLLLIPMHDENVIAIDKISYGVSGKGRLETNDLKHTQNKRQFLAIYKSIEGNVYLQKNGCFDLWIFEKSSNFRKKSFMISIEKTWNVLRELDIFKRRIFMENVDLGLVFISQALGIEHKEKGLTDGKYGINIWKYLK